MTRRTVLVSSLALGAAAVAGGLAHLPGPAAGLQVLSPREVRIVEAIAAVMFPAGVFPVHGGDGGTAPLVDAGLQEMLDPAAIVGFRYLLRAIQIGTLVSRGVHFADLPVAEAREVLDVWASEDPAPRRLASDTFKVVLGLGFFRRPEVLGAIGWRPGCPTSTHP